MNNRLGNNLLAGGRLHAIINVAGLALGLAVCLIVYLFVRHELGHDRHFSESERIVLVGQRSSNNVRGSREASSPMVAARLPGRFDFIEDATRTAFSSPVMLASANLETDQGDLLFVDARFLRIFDFIWLRGDVTALDVPDGLVLTESLALQYFGSVAAAHGALMEYGKDRQPLRVTGVIADLPAATHFSFKGLLPMALREAGSTTEYRPADWWSMVTYYSYVLLREPMPAATLAAYFDTFTEQELAGQEVQVRFHVTPLERIYLERPGAGLISDRFLRAQVAIAIAVAVLLIAVINFVNLATVAGIRRVVEVGLHRTVGASRLQVAGRILRGSLAMTCAAALLALVLVELLLPAVNAALLLELGLPGLSPLDWGLLLAGVLGVGLLAGAWPASVFAWLKPVAALRGEGHRGRSGAVARNVLVVLQFSLAITLVVCTLVFMRQVGYLRNQDPGFDTEQIVVVSLPTSGFFDLGSRWPRLRDELRADPGVEDAVYGLSSPMLDGILRVDLRPLGESLDPGGAGQLASIATDTDYLRFYGAHLLAGEFFDAEALGQGAADEDGIISFAPSFILNAAAARHFGWTPQEAVGQLFQWGDDEARVLRVRGVVGDFVSNPRREPPATAFLLAREGFRSSLGMIHIRVAPAGVARTLQHIDTVWREHFPGEPIRRRFLDERVEEALQADRRQLPLFQVATLLAIGIACFGLYGLAVFNAERRTKEIGVRKVLGSSVWRIVVLLTNDFSKLVLISNVIAWPLAWVAMNRWLEQFAYRIDLTPMIFIGSGLIALCVAWVTVGGTAAKAASRKPVLALRYE